MREFESQGGVKVAALKLNLSEQTPFGCNHVKSLHHANLKGTILALVQECIGHEETIRDLQAIAQNTKDSQVHFQPVKSRGECES